MYGLKDNKSNLIIKISKGQSEAVYRRMTDNTMARRKRIKRQIMIYKQLYTKLLYNVDI
jgi:hypothetical protein